MTVPLYIFSGASTPRIFRRSLNVFLTAMQRVKPGGGQGFVSGSNHPVMLVETVEEPLRFREESPLSCGAPELRSGMPSFSGIVSRSLIRSLSLFPLRQKNGQGVHRCFWQHLHGSWVFLSIPDIRANAY